LTIVVALTVAVGCRRKKTLDSRELVSGRPTNVQKTENAGRIKLVFGCLRIIPTRGIAKRKIRKIKGKLTRVESAGRDLHLPDEVFAVQATKHDAFHMLPHCLAAPGIDPVGLPSNPDRRETSPPTPSPSMGRGKSAFRLGTGQG
jgi:hypothetical protein